MKQFLHSRINVLQSCRNLDKGCLMFWYKKDKEQVVVGLTNDSLKELGQIWQFIPRIKVGDSVRNGQAVATVETTTGLRSLIIVLNGVLYQSNTSVLTDPESIDETTTIFTFSKVNYAMLGL